jgi:hypothetical protein
MSLLKIEPNLLDSTANFVFGNTFATGYYYANGTPLTSGGGSGTPGGTDTQVQFNDSGAFAGNASLTFNKTTGLLVAGHLSGEGGNISNIAVANITGLGNIATINKDGNASNILYGNGVFAAAPVAGASGGDVTFVNDSFTGDGSTVTFTISASPSSKNQTSVNYNGATVLRSDYSITGNVVTFTSAPANGAVIEITTVGMNLAYTSIPTVSGTNVTGQVANALVAGTVYTNAQPNITSVGTLTSLAVTGNITSGNITGANLISGNYVAGTLTTAAQPNITSVGTLTSLAIAGLLSESFGTKTGATGTVAHDVTVTNTYYHSSPAANFTANFTNVPTTSSKIIVVTLVIAQGSTPYVPSTFQIDGTTTSVSWLGGSAPTGNASKYDVISYSLFRVGSAWTVFGSASSFG